MAQRPPTAYGPANDMLLRLHMARRARDQMNQWNQLRAQPGMNRMGSPRAMPPTGFPTPNRYGGPFMASAAPYGGVLGHMMPQPYRLAPRQPQSFGTGY